MTRIPRAAAYSFSPARSRSVYRSCLEKAPRTSFGRDGTASGNESDPLRCSCRTFSFVVAIESTTLRSTRGGK